MENSNRKLSITSRFNDDQLWCSLLLLGSCWSALLQDHAKSKIQTWKLRSHTIHCGCWHSFVFTFLTPQLQGNRFPILLPIIHRLLNSMSIHLRNLALDILHHINYASHMQQKIQWGRLRRLHWKFNVCLRLTLLLHNFRCGHYHQALQAWFLLSLVRRSIFGQWIYLSNLCSLHHSLPHGIPQRRKSFWGRLEEKW